MALTGDFRFFIDFELNCGTESQFRVITDHEKSGKKVPKAYPQRRYYPASQERLAGFTYSYYGSDTKLNKG